MTEMINVPISEAIDRGELFGIVRFNPCPDYVESTFVKKLGITVCERSIVTCSSVIIHRNGNISVFVFGM